MVYLTAKESRVEKAWNKRGLPGLRSELLQRIGQLRARDFEDSDMALTAVREIAHLVYNELPEREWDSAEQYIAETCGLLDIDTTDYSTEIMQARLAEETLREDIGDD